MILFFGTRLGKKRITQLSNLACPYCGQKDTLQGNTQPNYVHLFWLPIIKIGSLRSVECSHCKRFFYKEEFTKDMDDVMRK